jgi:hypothetical protein
MIGDEAVPTISAPWPETDVQAGTSAPSNPFRPRDSSFETIAAVSGVCCTTTPAIAWR